MNFRAHNTQPFSTYIYGPKSIKWRKWVHCYNFACYRAGQNQKFQISPVQCKSASFSINFIINAAVIPIFVLATCFLVLSTIQLIAICHNGEFFPVLLQAYESIPG